MTEEKSNAASCIADIISCLPDTTTTTENIPQESQGSFMPSLDEIEAACAEMDSGNLKVEEEKVEIRDEAGIHTNDQTTVQQYFAYYAKLYNQQNMLEDDIRTGIYRKAILDNKELFQGKIVMDVGAGTSILSIFAAQAGAKKVYAVEASNMADHAKALIAHNDLANIIEVICAKVEDIPIESIP